MSLDGFVLKALVIELNDQLSGLRCEKIHQPARHTITFNLSGFGNKFRLVVSCDPQWPRLLVSSENFTNPASPPFFCLLLRKHLTGAKLLSLSMDGFERVVAADFSGRDELGNPTTYRLMVEIMGRHSNVVLVNADGQIIDAITRVSLQTDSPRPLLPGLKYELPPAQDKLSPLELTSEQVSNAAQAGATPLPKMISNAIQGLSRLLAQEMLWRHTSFQALADDVRILAYAAANSEIKEGYLYLSEKALFHITPLTHLNLPGERITGVNALLSAAFLADQEREQCATLRHSLRKVATTLLQKVERRIIALRDDLEKSEDRHQYKRWGDLLYANLGSQNVTGNEATVIDYYDEAMPIVRVPLNPRLGFQDNARHYFKQYTRAQATGVHASERLKKDEQYLEYLASLRYSIDSAPDISTLQEIRREMCDTGILVPESKGKKLPVEPSSPRIYYCPLGVRISVGRTNTQNDRLVREAQPENYWLHVQKAPGSHVIVHSMGTPSADTLNYAANLAAYYSSLRESSNVNVDYTLRKYVRRQAQAQPGHVIYENQRTIVIRHPHEPQ